jgi:GMP synthase (glutamine-hydrolysing)
MIYLVDNTIDGQGASPREIESALERIRPDLEILVEPFQKVSLERVQALSPSHIILSGQSHPWESYPDNSLSGVYDVIRNAPQPILGVCGGHQQMALALGAPVGLMERLEAGEGYAGAKRERGFLPVETDGHGLFDGLPSEVTVWHSHCDEVKRLPEGFRRTAHNATCAIQAMQHESKPLFGVQFHPELFDETHSEGKKILENFLATKASD